MYVCMKETRGMGMDDGWTDGQTLKTGGLLTLPSIKAPIYLRFRTQLWILVTNDCDRKFRQLK